MAKLIDITGQKFARLTVIKRDYNTRTNGKAYWLCNCDCGKQVSVRGQDLRLGKIKSCGCYNSQCRTEKNLKDIKGQRFGKLVAVKSMGVNEHHRNTWLCQCDCGKTTVVETTSLTMGNTKSCGCIISNGENMIAEVFDQHNIVYKQQYTFENLVGDQDNKTRLRFDFAILDNNNNLKCLIEYQGQQHFIPFHNDTEETFMRRQRYDQKKRDYCLNQNIPLVEISYLDKNKLNWDFLYEKLQPYI